MTQLFAAFTAPSAPAYFPGVSFLAAAVLSALCLCIFIPLVRSHQFTALGKPKPSRAAYRDNSHSGLLNSFLASVFSVIPVSRNGGQFL